MQNLSLIQMILLFAFPAILAITVHEAAHGYAARHFGDRTAEMLGRLTLNPIKHIDPIGTILVPLGMLALAKATGAPTILFGWAKPVPVGTRNLGNPRRDMALVAAAGPGSNFAMATGWALILGLANSFGHLIPASEYLTYMAYFGVFINVLLAVINLVPIPPLDGGRVLSGLLPPKTAMTFDRIEPFGLMIIIMLLVSGVLWNIIGPIISAVLAVFLGLASW